MRGFLAADELEHWKETTQAAVAERGAVGRKHAGAMHHSIPYRWATQPDVIERESLRGFGDDRLTQRTNLWMTNDAMRELMLCPRIGKMMGELSGSDGMRIWHDSALHKEPFALPTSLHIDNPRWGFTSSGAINCWVALGDVGIQNGCMFCESSKRLPRPPTRPLEAGDFCV